MATESWIARQVQANAARFDDAVRRHHPEHARFFEDPAEFHRGLTELWNFLDAAKRVAWNEHLPEGAVCLDLGGGTGWLSAYLSTFPRVSKIFLLDSSRHFLEAMRPEIERLMKADGSKIVPIEGFFTPILMPDGTLDAVVASSALHHAENLEEALREVHRVLKDGGTLFVVNELPHGDAQYIFFLAKGFLAILARSVLRLYRPASRALSSSGVLDDPLLGDRRYPYWYWKEALARAGFDLVQVQKTGLSTLKSGPRDMELVNFICRKRSAGSRP